MVVVGKREAWETRRGEFGCLWPRGAEWLWRGSLFRDHCGDDQLPTPPSGVRGRRRRLRRGLSCAPKAVPSLFPFDPHLLAMPGVLEGILLVFWLAVSLAVTLLISVPLAGALVRLRGKSDTLRSRLWRPLTLHIQPTTTPKPPARPRRKCERSHWSRCHVVLRDAKACVSYRSECILRDPMTYSHVGI